MATETKQQPLWAITPEKVDAVVHRLVEVASPLRIYLFGSYARGQTRRDSDLDLLIVVDDAVANTREESVRLRRAVRDIHMPMDILVVRARDFEALRDRIGLIYREVAREGQLVFEQRQAA